MISVSGKYNTAKIFTDNVDDETVGQVINVLNQPFVKDSKVRIMPDAHAGAGCVIGTTMSIKDKVVPNLVGVDIGCGMFVAVLGQHLIDLPALDKYIHENIPNGFEINKESQVNFKKEINELICLRELKKYGGISSTRTFNRGIGSLGGGNHFIELNVDDDGNVFLVIHSGSRNMGLQIANHYQRMAVAYHNGIDDTYNNESKALIERYKATGRRKEISDALKSLKEKHSVKTGVPDELAYLEGRLMDYYLYDLKIAQNYAGLNREVMAQKIIEFLGIDPLLSFHTIHNYVDLTEMILRKGAVSAKKDELFIIPMNMRDGSLLAYGKGNADWNYSAPHGAGRLMSRRKAKELISLGEFERSMDGIFTTSVKESTLDESPYAYKPMDDIINNIGETADIIKVIRPIYNFKAS